jgi:glutathione peroxidase
MVLAFAWSAVRPAAAAEATALAFEAKSIEGEKVELGQFKGKVVLIVNVASRCGLTGQYDGLQALYEKYKDQDFVILGFPCNQFGGQEPAAEADIKQFCTTKFGVTFPMFSKVNVNGPDATPLYKFLTSQETKPQGSGKVSWNFEKFLIGKDGKVAARFSPATTPDAAELVTAIESALK